MRNAVVVAWLGMSGARRGLLRGFWWGLVAACLTLALVRSAAAQDRVAKLAEQLTNSDDFRVRTQAALALGASKNRRAVAPLCAGLADSSTTVRAAAAAALGKLNLGGASCLKRRLADEASSMVKATIRKALAILELESERVQPAVDASTRYYLAIAKTADKTGRNAGQVDELVQTAVRNAVLALDGYAMAPNSERPGEARKLFTKYKKIKGFYLAPKVSAPQYSAGKLIVKVELAIFTYPDRALKGSVPIKLTQQDVSGEDRAAEDELIKLASERAIEKFAGNVERIE